MNDSFSSTISSFTSDHPSRKEKCLSPLLMEKNSEIKRESTSIFYNKNLKQFCLKFELQAKYAKDLNEWLKKNGKCGIVTIKLKNRKRITINSILLSKHSCRYNRLIKSYTENININAENFNGETFEKITQFLNTGDMVFNINELPELLRTSNAFEIVNIVTILESALLIHLPDNTDMIVDTLNMSSNPITLFSTKMKWHISNTANYYLKNIINDKYFGKLSPAGVVSVLSNDELEIYSEFDVMKLCLIYILNEDKFLYADSLFNCIRMSQMSNDEIQRMEDEIVIFNEDYLTRIFKNYTNRLVENNGKKVFTNFNVLPPRKSHLSANCSITLLIDEIYKETKKIFLEKKRQLYRIKRNKLSDGFKSYTLSTVTPKFQEKIVNLRNLKSSLRNISYYNSFHKDDSE